MTLQKGRFLNVNIAGPFRGVSVKITSDLPVQLTRGN